MVNDPVGLHARPASMFVELAGRFSSEIRLRNMSEPETWVNAKSILSVLSCAVQQGDQIEVQAEGEDEEQAVQDLQSLIDEGFKAGEEPAESEQA
jgi:phosphotransferase system HPr (HPr) family protein